MKIKIAKKKLLLAKTFFKKKLQCFSKLEIFYIIEVNGVEQNPKEKYANITQNLISLY